MVLILYTSSDAALYSIFIEKNSKGHHSVQNVGEVTVLFHCTSSDGGLYLYNGGLYLYKVS